MPAPATPASLSGPARDCALCPRLVAYRRANRSVEPAWYNGAVPSFGSSHPRLLIVGLAPGRGGANRTGRPFTGDYAGDLLYQTLLDFGFAAGIYAASPDDGLALRDCRITNAVRCAPPDNKPTPLEISTCGTFLKAEIEGLTGVRAILALGRIAHDAVVAAHGRKRSEFAFAHGARHRLTDVVALYDSFHCSRYNTNTRRLTPEMFRDVFDAIRAELSAG